jgi:UDP-glucose 4-epimerase
MVRFLVTGGAGFIGANMVQHLLSRGHAVSVLDDFSTGKRGNLPADGSSFTLIEGSICDPAAVSAAMKGCDCCIHLAAIPSVARSIHDPLASNRANVEGSIHVFLAARDAGLRRVVYASSSSVYGNAPRYPVDETLPRAPISPYGVSKAAVEMYAETFSRLFGIELVGLRYFNVFGPRQDPDSAYAAVIPRFITRMLRKEAPVVYGDGLHARDFTYVDNVTEANLAACLYPAPLTGVFNIACGRPIRLLDLVQQINRCCGTDIAPVFEPPRAGDILRSEAAITRAHEAFGFTPRISFEDGLAKTVAWYQAQGA